MSLEDWLSGRGGFLAHWRKFVLELLEMHPQRVVYTRTHSRMRRRGVPREHVETVVARLLFRPVTGRLIVVRTGFPRIRSRLFVKEGTTMEMLP